MSSVQEKIGSAKKSFLLRSSSLQKIKCSAYPLLGSIFSKDSSYIHLFDNAMNSSRALLEKPMIVVVIPTIQFLSVVMAFLVQAIRKLTGGVSFERLDKFIANINQLEPKHQSFSVQKQIKNRSKQEAETGKQDESLMARAESSDEEKFFDCFEEIVTKTAKHNFLRITSFICIFLVYLQFSLLIVLIGCTQLRAGFIFLILGVFSINYLMLKISFIKNSEEKRASRGQHKTNSGEIKVTNSTRSLLEQFRSRSNKVKLL